MYNLIIAAILIVAFFMCIKAYTMGFKHGKEVREGITPKINLNPVEAIKEHREKKEEKVEDLAAEGWKNILSYDGTPQIKEER